MLPVSIKFELNGVHTTHETQPDRPLLDVLRDDLNLTGTKKGCDYEGLCGTCTVIIDGKARRACRTPISKISGKRVFTIEGLSLGEDIHAIQQAFIDHGSVQCGYCTPGMIMSTKALLDHNPTPTRDQINHAIQGNLCRCTGYKKIVAAILDLAADFPTPIVPIDDHLVGGSQIRHDSLGKVTGETKFAGDIRLPSMLHLNIKRSVHSFGKIISIDKSLALAVPGVVAVYTAQNIPGVKSFSDLWGSKDDQVSTEFHPSTALEPLLADDLVRMQGEPIALVVGEDAQSAQAGSDAIQVSYDPLEPIFDPQLALADTAYPLHPGGNLYEIGEIKKGDVNKSLAGADITVELDFVQATQDHVTIEPNSVLGYIDANGRVVVIGPSHQPHARKLQIAQMLDIDPDDVRVIVSPMGGSFGGHHHFWPLLAVALPTYLLKQPVRLVFKRSEVFEASLKRHAFKTSCQIGATKDGVLTSLHTKAIGNAGPYGGAPTIAAFVALCGMGPYKWPAIDNECRIAHTNWANAGPYRGYGMPQGVLGLECTLDEVARQLHIDPLDMRYNNIVNNEDGTTTGQSFDEYFAIKEVLDAINPKWLDMQQSTRQLQARSSEHLRYGVGLATNWYQYGKSGEFRTSAQAGLNEAGEIVLYYSAYTAGIGSDSVLNQLASEVLDVPRDEIFYVNNDTDFTLDSKITGACRTTYWVGGAVQQAARQLKEEILSTATEWLNVPAEILILTGTSVYEKNNPSNLVSLKQIANLWRQNGYETVFTGVMDLEDRFRHRDTNFHQLGHFVCGVAIAQVSLNKKTGKINVLKVDVAQDVGRAINPINLQGQIEGAVVMEVGSVLMEEHIPGQTVNFKKYPIPRAKDVPDIEVILVEVPGMDGPLGVKGAGEAVMGHSRAAILNAISDAAGTRITRVPVTPARLLRALDM